MSADNHRRPQTTIDDCRQPYTSADKIQKPRGAYDPGERKAPEKLKSNQYTRHRKFTTQVPTCRPVSSKEIQKKAPRIQANITMTSIPIQQTSPRRAPRLPPEGSRALFLYSPFSNQYIQQGGKVLHRTFLRHRMPHI